MKLMHNELKYIYTKYLNYKDLEPLEPQVAARYAVSLLQKQLGTSLYVSELLNIVKFKYCKV